MPEQIEQPTTSLFETPGGRWLQDFASDYATGTAMRYSGKLLQHVPGVKWLGRPLESWGKFSQLYAAPDATIGSINRAAGWDQDTPTTAVGHAKKWLRSAGTEAALGTALWGAGMAISAIPHPATVAGGRALALLAKAGPALASIGAGARHYAIYNASFGTLADLLGNHMKKQQEEQEQRRQHMLDMQAKYKTNAQKMNMLGAGIAGLAGLGGAHLIVNTIPVFRRKKYLKYLAYTLAAAGAGYAGWKYAQDQQNKLTGSIT